MKHLLLFLYVLIFSTGFAGLIAVVFSYIRTGRKDLLLFSILQILFMVSLAMNFIYHYLDEILMMIAPESGQELVFGVALSIIQICMIIVLERLVSQYTERDSLTRWIRILLLFAVLSMVMSLVSNILREVGLFKQISKYLVYGITPAAISGTGLVLYLGVSDEEDILYRGIGICLMLFLPLGLIELAVEIHAIKPITLEYIIYLGCNIVFILAALRIYRDPANQEDSVLPMRDRFSLTARETEILPYIAKGFTNKEIAFELSVSEATIRTHIYNIFKKTGVRSRIELLNLL